MKKNIILLGAGAQAQYICETWSFQNDIGSICVIAKQDSPHLDWPSRYGADYLVGYEHIVELAKTKQYDYAIVGVATACEKQRLTKLVHDSGLSLLSAIHPAAIIATTATIGSGAIINAGAVIQPFARLGEGVMIHAHVTVEHGCIIDDYANLAPGVSIAGYVKIGKGVTIFTGANVIPHVSIGEGAIIGAGATVLRDVSAWQKVAGCPARVLV